jgi:biotin carboxyl carrier protein
MYINSFHVNDLLQRKETSLMRQKLSRCAPKQDMHAFSLDAEEKDDPVNESWDPHTNSSQTSGTVPYGTVLPIPPLVSLRERGRYPYSYVTVRRLQDNMKYGRLLEVLERMKMELEISSSYVDSIEKTNS